MDPDSNTLTVFFPSVISWVSCGFHDPSILSGLTRQGAGQGGLCARARSVRSVTTVLKSESKTMQLLHCLWWLRARQPTCHIRRGFASGGPGQEHASESSGSEKEGTARNSAHIVPCGAAHARRARGRTVTIVRGRRWPNAGGSRHRPPATRRAPFSQVREHSLYGYLNAWGCRGSCFRTNDATIVVERAVRCMIDK